MNTARKLLLNVLLLFISQITFAQKWTFTATRGEYFERPYRLCKDDNGNIYQSGYFDNTFTILEETHLSYGQDDASITKYTPGGKVLWFRTIGGSRQEKIKDIQYKNGIIYFSGSFQSESLYNENGLLLNNTIQFPYHSECFLGAMDTSGTLLWIKHFGGIGNSYLECISVTNSAIYGTGYFYNDFNAGNNIIDSAYGAPATANGFLAKFDLLGSAIWSRIMKGYKGTRGDVLCNDSAENVYIAGEFGSYIGSDTLFFGTQSIISIGRSDIFLAKLDSGGNVLNLRCEGDTSYEQPRCIYQLNDQLLMGGTYSNYSTIGGTLYSTNTGQEGFLVAYDLNLIPQWSHAYYRVLPVSLPEYITAICSDKEDNYYVLQENYSNQYIFNKIDRNGNTLESDTLWSTGSIGNDELDDLEIDTICGRLYLSTPIYGYLTDNTDTLYTSSPDAALAVRNLTWIGHPENLQSSTGNFSCYPDSVFDVSFLSVSGALGYVWRVEPSDSVSVTGSGTNITLHVTPGYYGKINIYVHAVANCFESEDDTLIVNAKAPLLTPVVLVNQAGVYASQTGESYIWLYNGNVLPNDTTMFVNVAGTGSYQVAIVIDGCVSTFSPPVLVTSIDNPDKKGQKSFYPNPVSDFIFFRNVNPSAIIKIRDINGRILSGQRNISNKIDLRFLAKGVYILSITDDKSTDNFRLIKQ